jgi:hypothetical protein
MHTWSQFPTLPCRIAWSHRASSRRVYIHTFGFIANRRSGFVSWLHVHWTTQQLFGMFCYLCKVKKIYDDVGSFTMRVNGNSCMFSPIFRSGWGEFLIVTWILTRTMPYVLMVVMWTSRDGESNPNNFNIKIQNYIFPPNEVTCCETVQTIEDISITKQNFLCDYLWE